MCVSVSLSLWLYFLFIGYKTWVTTPLEMCNSAKRPDQDPFFFFLSFFTFGFNCRVYGNRFMCTAFYQESYIETRRAVNAAFEISAKGQSVGFRNRIQYPPIISHNYYPPAARRHQWFWKSPTESKQPQNHNQFVSMATIIPFPPPK